MNLMEKYLNKIQENNVNGTHKPKSQNAPIAEDKSISLRQAYEEKFNELAEILSRYALTADEIKMQCPELYNKIQDAISEMDSAWLHGDLESFIKTTKTIEELYFKALQGGK
jgi:hypothetical protein